MKVITILGTRPEIIKLSPLIPLLENEFEHSIIHTGQHYDYEMDKAFFTELKLPQPRYHLNVGSSFAGKQTALMIERIEAILLQEQPEWVIVQGDTNTVLAGALAAAKLNIKIAHVESGDRNFNKQTPEEINRTVADHVADLLFAADERCYQNLVHEGLPENKIFLEGNTVYDACVRANVYAQSSPILEELKLEAKKYVIVTIHRAESTEKKEILEGIVKALNEISHQIPLVFPLHPRTKKFFHEYGLTLSPQIKVVKPLEYLPFLKLLSNARFCISESGGVQEEALVFNIPCVIPLNETCWPHLVEAGKNFLVGQTTSGIVRKAKELLDDLELQRVAVIPYAYDHQVSEKIIEILKRAS